MQVIGHNPTAFSFELDGAKINWLGCVEVHNN